MSEPQDPQATPEQLARAVARLRKLTVEAAVTAKLKELAEDPDPRPLSLQGLKVYAVSGDTPPDPQQLLKDAQPLPPEEGLRILLTRLGQTLGSELLHDTPAAVLEQFVLMAGLQQRDPTELLQQLLRTFIASFISRSTSDRALATLEVLADLLAELQTTHATPSTKH